MPRDIKALKNKKGTKKAEQTQPESDKKQEEDVSPSNLKKDQETAEKTQEKINESPVEKGNKQFDSDEESEDDADIQTGSNLYKMITENTENQNDDTKIEGYGLDDQASKPQTTAQDKVVKPKKDASNITFGGRGGPPRFTKGIKNRGFAGEFEDRLDDIDDDGKVNKKQSKPQERQQQLSGANGGFEFRNLGSTAQSRTGQGFQRNEEEKSNSNAAPQRPRFTGKLNLTGTGGKANEQNSGVTTNYGFNVKYKQDNDGKRPFDKDKEKKTDGDSEPQMRKDRRHIDRGFNKNKNFQDQQDDLASPEDEGFEVVKDKQKLRTQQRRINKYKQESSNSDDDNDGFTITTANQRGGQASRGKPNRGGAFAGMDS